MNNIDRIIQLGGSDKSDGVVEDFTEEQVNSEEEEEDKLEDTPLVEEEEELPMGEDINLDDKDELEDIPDDISEDEEIDEYTENVNKTTIISNFETYSNYYANKKYTSPILGKFERAKILGVRAEMLAAGAEPFISPPIPDNTYEVALRELKEKKIPLMIRRYLPNGSIEDWRLEDLIIR